MAQRNIIQKIILLSMFGTVFWPHITPVRAETSPQNTPKGFLTPSQIEVMQAQASLEYHSQKYAAAEKTLRTILYSVKQNTQNQIDALELLALVYRQTGDDSHAAGAYRKLLEITPESKHAAYQFELAMIRFKQKKISEAHELFQAASDADFNPGTSRFFLGLIDLEDKNYRLALYHFTESKDFSDSAALEPAINFYLGNTYLILGKTESAIRNFKKVDASTSTNALAKQAGEGSEKTLKSLDSSQTFANVSLSTQWDSNVQSNPVEVSNSSGLSNQRSLKSVISASIAHSTSPLNNWQFTPMYSFYGNYNYNKPTRAYNFITNTLGAYVFYKPYLQLSKGFKAQSTLSMKNSPVREGETLFTKYSLTEEIGPTFKYELTSRSFLGLDLLFKPKHFYGDTTGNSSNRSGSGFYVKTTYDTITTSSYLIPQLTASFESDNTDGTQYDMTAWAFGVANTLQLPLRQSIRASFDVTLSSYPTNSTKPRSDKNYAARVYYSRPINKTWTATVDTSYTINRSNIPSSYSYTRVLGSVGATYNF